MRSLVARLTDARDYARSAAHHVKGIGFAEFSADAVRREAVCFCLLIVGEACTEAAKGFVGRPTQIPWAEIKGMRNILVHEYWQIDNEIVYNVAHDEAEELAIALDELLKE